MRFIVRHGKLVRTSNRFGGFEKQRFRDSWELPWHLRWSRRYHRILKHELAEEVVDLDVLLCVEDLPDVEIEFCGDRRFAIQLTPEGCLLVRHQLASNGASPVSPDGSCRESIMPRSWFRRHPHSPSWL
ncbi:MAG: hypothetical protein HY567_03615 [Candidatus Kerfeldbacteria bacterium]|nr:hypothetical protein [Candidatus Kerfeldbacteria bacterium]